MPEGTLLGASGAGMPGCGVDQPGARAGIPAIFGWGGVCGCGPLMYALYEGTFAPEVAVDSARAQLALPADVLHGGAVESLAGEAPECSIEDGVLARLDVFRRYLGHPLASLI